MGIVDSKAAQQPANMLAFIRTLLEVLYLNFLTLFFFWPEIKEIEAEMAKTQKKQGEGAI